MASVTIHICTTCRDPADEAAGIETRAGARLHAAVAALAGERGDIAVIGVECLSVCKRPCTVGFSAPGKWTYVYGDFAAGTGAETILAGAALYAQAPDGLIPWRQRPDALKKGVVSRMPPLSAAPMELALAEAAR